MIVDQSSVRTLTVASEDTQGASFEETGTVILVMVPEAEISGLLSAYDADNQYSPSAADARLIARVVLDALKAHNDE
jgi:hypothetical protein